MAKHRTHSIAFKRQVVQEYLAGETLDGLARRHDLSRNLIRIWVDKYKAGAFDEEAEAANTLQEYEARIAALERLVGKQALELEFLRGAQRQGRQSPLETIFLLLLLRPWGCGQGAKRLVHHIHRRVVTVCLGRGVVRRRGPTPIGTRTH